MDKIIDKYGEFVNDQVHFQTNQSKRFANNAFRRDLHLATATNLRGLYDEAIRLEVENLALKKKLEETEASADRASLVEAGIPTTVQLALKPEDVEGLPQDVLDELSVSAAEPMDFKVLSVINDAGGILTLDRIIIGLFKTYQEKIKRPTLTSRLNRMIPKGLLHPVPGRKGLYSTTPTGADEAQAQLDDE